MYIYIHTGRTPRTCVYISTMCGVCVYITTMVGPVFIHSFLPASNTPLIDHLVMREVRGLSAHELSHDPVIGEWCIDRLSRLACTLL